MDSFYALVWSSEERMGQASALFGCASAPQSCCVSSVGAKFDEVFFFHFLHNCSYNYAWCPVEDRRVFFCDSHHILHCVCIRSKKNPIFFFRNRCWRERHTQPFLMRKPQNGVFRELLLALQAYFWEGVE